MTVRRLLYAIAAATVAALALLGFGFTWSFVIGWSLLVGAIALLAQLAIPLDPSADAPHIAIELDRRPTEISRMAWALNTHTGQAGQQVTRRVGGILRHRLQRRGVDPDDPAQRTRMSQFVEPDLWDRVTGSGTSILDVERALDAIDALAPAADGRPPTDPPAREVQRSLFRRARR